MLFPKPSVGIYQTQELTKEAPPGKLLVWATYSTLNHLHMIAVIYIRAHQGQEQCSCLCGSRSWSKASNQAQQHFWVAASHQLALLVT